MHTFIFWPGKSVTQSPTVKEVIQLYESNHKHHNFKHHISQISMLDSVKKKKEGKKSSLSFSSFSYLSFLFKITQKCNSHCFVPSGFNFLYEKITKPTNLRVILLAQSSISLIKKVQENRSIAVSEVFFPSLGFYLVQILAFCGPGIT